jgi:hypothetical protein
VPGKEVKKLTAERFVPFLPAPAALVKLILCQGFPGEPLIVSVAGADLDVGLTDDASVAGASVAGASGLGDEEIAVW